MKCARFKAFLASWALLALQSTPASAWGWQGHQYIGNLGYKLMTANARKHVRDLLGVGVDLGHAAVWPDCVRSVEGADPAHLSYNERDPYEPKVCEDFTAAERQRMVDYAARNWTQCQYKGTFAECHKRYHFADVNVHEHDTYDRSFFGTEDYDVVQAIKAAMSVLKCKTGQPCSSTAPFNIASKREALLILAHFVGDLHQPLHVGAIYLDPNNVPGDDAGKPTAGGNLLLLSPGSTSNNLHHKWDTVLDSIGVVPSQQAIDSGCLIAPLPSPTPEPPEVWASQSVLAAQSAYAGMTFTVNVSNNDYWDAHLADPAGYASGVRNVQARQLITAGARLAALLNSVWPSTKVAVACR